MFDLLSPLTWFSSSGGSPDHRRGSSSFFSQSSTSHYSVRELERLHDLLLSEDKLLSRTSSRSLSSLASTGHRHQKYIEALRAISEIVVWADQRTEGNSDASTLEEGSAIVELFLSRSMVKYFHEVLEASADDEEVVMQVLQTMNILIQNLRNEQTVYCVFSNNRVNEILSMDSVFLVGRAGAADDNDDVIGLYVNLLKTIVMRLDTHSVEFFLKEGRVCVPYTRVLRVAELDVARQDGMVRAAVRAVVLKLYSIVPPSVCLGGMKTAEFFGRLCDEVVGTMVELEVLLRGDRWRGGDGDSEGENETILARQTDDALRIDSLLGRLEDDMAFFNDVLRTRRGEVSQLALRGLWTKIVLGSILVFQGARTSSTGGSHARARMLTALLVLEAVCKALESPSLMGLMVSLLLTGDSVKAAEAVIEDLGIEELTVDELIGAGHGEGDVIDRKGLRASLLSCLTDPVVDPACRVVVLRLLAVMLDGSTSDAVLRAVGLLSIDAGDAAEPVQPTAQVGGPGEPVASNAADSAMNLNTNGVTSAAANPELASFPVGSGQLFESEFSVCFPERCAELQGAIFSAAIAFKQAKFASQYEVHALTYVAWILRRMLQRGTVVIAAPIGPLQELLARTHDGLLLCLPTSLFGYAAPMILNHCWSVQQQYLTTLRPCQAPSKLSTVSQAGRDGDRSLCRTLTSATRFVAAYQLYQLVSSGTPDLDSTSPFATELGLPTPSRTITDKSGGEDEDSLMFRTSLGKMELGKAIIVRDEAGSILFEAPTPTVTLTGDSSGEQPKTERSTSATMVTLAARTAQLARGTLRTKSSIIRDLAFDSKLDRRFVEHFIREARREAAEQCRIYLEHCI